MYDRIKTLIERIHSELCKNALVKRVYKDSENESRSSSPIKNINEVSIDSLFRSFLTNLSYLEEFVVQTDTDSEVNSDIFDLSLEIKQIQTAAALVYDKDLLLLIIETNILLVIYSVVSVKEQELQKLISVDGQKLINTYPQKPNTYYRGQVDYSYNLIPSIFRNLKEYNGKNVTYKELFKIYNSRNLVKRYAKVFPYSSVDYAFCSFMQHATSFSPYLDFSEDAKIALSFASTNAGLGMNDYVNKDASIYEISFSENLPVLDEKQPFRIDVFLLNGRLKPTSLIRDKELYYCTYKDFEVDACIITNKSNDRMKYQKGVFLYFRKCVIVNGIILMPLGFGNITKYRIPAKAIKPSLSKKEVYEFIKKNYREIDYEHLMNPYLYFSDSPLPL